MDSKTFTIITPFPPPPWELPPKKPTSMHFSSSASGELLETVSNMVTKDNRVVTSSTILPGTMSGTTTKLPQLMDTKSVDGR